MTEDQDFENALDQEIENRNIEYHFDNFLKNVLGVHDLDQICSHHTGLILMATYKHIQEREEALEESEDESPDIGNN